MWFQVTSTSLLPRRVARAARRATTVLALPERRRRRRRSAQRSTTTLPAGRAAAWVQPHCAAGSRAKGVATGK
jgi:hypothetical protein